MKKYIGRVGNEKFKFYLKANLRAKSPSFFKIFILLPKSLQT